MTDSTLKRVAEKLFPGTKLLRSWELQGGVSARVVGLELRLPNGAVRKMVLRQHGAADLARDPSIAAHEFRLLQRLQAAGVPVPAPLFYDESAAALPSPYIAIEFIEHDSGGVPSDANAIANPLADVLAAIHRIEPAEDLISFLRNQDELSAGRLASRPERLDESLSEGRVRDALAAVGPPLRRNRDALLHGDFWPGNTLWKQGRLAAVIDWEDAALGDPLADLANARLELLWT